MNARPVIVDVLLAGSLLCATGALAAKPAASAEKGSADQTAAVRDYLARDMVFVTSPGLVAYLEDIAARLLATQKKPPALPHFLIQSTSEFSIFTDIRGNIVVGSEVLRKVESEDELAAALSHELAHVLAGHANTRNLVQKLPSTVETTQAISLSVDGRGDNAGATAGELSGFAKGGLGTTQATGTVWTDLVAPGWNRQQERDADLAGVDMARAAGYDPAAFSSLFARLDAANATRSARVEALRQDALKRAKASAAPPKATFAKGLLAKAKGSAETTAVETAFEGLAGWGTDYDTPEQRTTTVLEHVNKASTGRRDKVPRSPRFAAELRSGSGQALLAADQSALVVMAAINSKKPQSAAASAESLLAAGATTAPLSPHLNLAIGSWLDTVEKKPDAAEQRAIAWTESDLAPRTAYLWLASYQVQQRDFGNAMATLDLGAERLGDRSLFLPQMISVSRADGDSQKADELGMECARSGVGANLATVAKIAELTTSKANSKPTGLYAECVAALGYDPVQRREQALQIQPAAGPKALPKLGESLAEKLRKALGH